MKYNPFLEDDSPETQMEWRKLEAMIQSANRETLEEILLSSCMENTELVNRIYLTLSGDAELIMSSIKEFIRQSKLENTHRGYIGWTGFDNVCHDMLTILEQVDILLKNQHYETAFEVSKYITLSIFKLCLTGDSSSGGWTSVVKYSMEALQCTIAQFSAHCADQHQRKKMYSAVISLFKNKAFDDWRTERYQLVEYLLPLITQKNSKNLYKAMDGISQKYLAEYPGHTACDEGIVARYQLMLHLEGDEAGLTYLNNHLDVDILRKIAIERAIQEGNFSKAEHLCLEKCVSLTPPQYHYPAQWDELLFQIYSQWGHLEKREAQAIKLLHMGQSKYYIHWKEQLQEQARWECEYDDAIALVNTLPTWVSMPILAQEGELEHLMELVRKNEFSCFTYGALLWGHYETEITQLCLDYICEKAERDNDRRQYRTTASAIADLAKMGGIKPAQKISLELRTRYPRRSAMVDELLKAEHKF